MDRKAHLLGSAFAALALALAAPAFSADDAKPKATAVPKVILENDKVKVIETTWKPGAITESVARGPRVARALQGGTLTRIYPDGKTEKITYKTGEVKWVDATPPYALKNEGKSPMTLYTVYPK